MTVSKKLTPKQIFELMLTQQLWAFDEEDFERMWLVFVNTFSEILQQKLEEEKQVVKAVCHNYLKQELSEERLQRVVIFHLGNYTRNLLAELETSS